MKLSKMNELIDLMPRLRNQVVIGRFGIQHPDCEDLENDIFIRCLKSLNQYDSDKSALSSWAFRVAIWTVLDFLKYRKLTFLPLVFDKESNDCSVDKKFLLSEILGAVYSDDFMLTSKQKIVAIRMLQGYNNTEIANIMGVTQAVVFQKKKKIINKVKERFETIEIKDAVNEH